jgi:hypothetical protein
MKRMILVPTVALVFSLAFTPISNAQMAKEGTVTVTHCYTYSLLGPSLNLGSPDKEAVLGELLAVVLSDTGKGPFHNMSSRAIFVLHYDKGERTGLGYGVWTDPDGDKVFDEITLKPQKTTGRFIGGTGKFAGIEGTVEVIEEIVLKPSKEGTTPTVNHMKIHWKLP